MTSAIACEVYTQMVKERAYDLRQSVIDTAFVVAGITEHRRSMAVDLINTLNPTEEQLLVGLRTACTDSASPSYSYDVGPYLIFSDECVQVEELEKNYCAGIVQVVKYQHVRNTGFISFDGKIFVYYLYPVTHNRSLIFLFSLEHFSLLSKPLAMDSENLMLSLFKSGKLMTGNEYNAKNAIFAVSGAMEHFSYPPTGLYILVYKKGAYFQVCTSIIFFTALMIVIPGASHLYLVHRMINHGIVEKEAIINDHFGRILDGGLFFSAANVKKLYSMYNSAFLDNLTKAMGRKSFDKGLEVLSEKGGYLCLFDVGRFKNINDTFSHLLGDGVSMKVVKILKSQIPVDKGKAYCFGGDESAMIYTGGTLEELLPILKEIAHFQVGGTNLDTSTGVAHSNERTAVERLRMLADERLYKSKKNGRAQISWQ